MAFTPDPAAAFLGDFGVAVVAGATTTTGILDEQVVVEDGDLGAAQVVRRVLRIPAGTLTLAPDDAVTVGGVAYRVRYVGEDVRTRLAQFADDGLLETVILTRDR